MPESEHTLTQTELTQPEPKKFTPMNTDERLHNCTLDLNEYSANLLYQGPKLNQSSFQLEREKTGGKGTYVKLNLMAHHATTVLP